MNESIILLVSVFLAWSIIIKYAAPKAYQMLKKRKRAIEEERLEAQNYLKEKQQEYSQANLFYISAMERRNNWKKEASSILEYKKEKIKKEYENKLSRIKHEVKKMKDIESKKEELRKIEIIISQLGNIIASKEAKINTKSLLSINSLD
jgi:F0F1-type ATP synthase membrane subunit b/b'